MAIANELQRHVNNQRRKIVLEFTNTEVNGQPDAVAAVILRRGYRAFAARKSSGGGDGRAECQATLDYGDDSVEGATGRSHGHAEMDALHNFWVDVCEKDLETFKQKLKDGVTIECTAKPCCARCAAILGAFGIAPTDETYKTRRILTGGGVWGMSLDLKNLMRQLFKIKPDAITELGAMSQSQVDKYVPND